MVFANKPAKGNSKKLNDKQKISLVNCDFKLLMGLENKRFTKIVSHTISNSQFALGQEKRIHHAIALARDTIHFSSLKTKDVQLQT